MSKVVTNFVKCVEGKLDLKSDINSRAHCLFIAVLLAVLLSDPTNARQFNLDDS